jgi:predicted transcriptional regulator
MKKNIQLEKLSHQEEEAMLAIWKAGNGFVKDFLVMMAEPQPHYNTLTSTIKNLEKKGYVHSRKVGNMYEYFPAVTEESYKKQFLTGLVKNYFADSYKDLVAFFAKDEKINKKELQEIMDMINKK